MQILLGMSGFFYNILGHLKLPQLYPSDQRPEVWWLWLHRCFGWHELGSDGKRNHAMPPFFVETALKKEFPGEKHFQMCQLGMLLFETPFWSVGGQWNQVWWVSPFSPHSDSGSVLFFLVRRWQDLGDGSSNSCKPPANQRKTSGFPTIFYLNPQSSQIKKVQEAWHHICDGKGRMTSRININ